MTSRTGLGGLRGRTSRCRTRFIPQRLLGRLPSQERIQNRCPASKAQSPLTTGTPTTSLITPTTSITTAGSICWCWVFPARRRSGFRIRDRQQANGRSTSRLKASTMNRPATSRSPRTGEKGLSAAARAFLVTRFRMRRILRSRGFGTRFLQRETGRNSPTGLGWATSMATAGRTCSKPKAGGNNPPAWRTIRSGLSTRRCSRLVARKCW